MLVHEVRVRCRRIEAEPREVVQHGVMSDALQLDLDGEWGEMERVSVVLAKGGESTALAYTGDPVQIPYELMEDPGPMYVTVIGRSGEARVVTERMTSPLSVVESGSVDGGHEPGDPVLDEVQQAISNAVEAAERADAAADRAGSLPTISCGSGDPAVGSNAGDLYIDSESGSLWEFVEGD